MLIPVKSLKKHREEQHQSVLIRDTSSIAFLLPVFLPHPHTQTHKHKAQLSRVHVGLYTAPMSTGKWTTVFTKWAPLFNAQAYYGISLFHARLIVFFQSIFLLFNIPCCIWVRCDRNSATCPYYMKLSSSWGMSPTWSCWISNKRPFCSWCRNTLSVFPCWINVMASSISSSVPLFSVLPLDLGMQKASDHIRWTSVWKCGEKSIFVWSNVGRVINA